MLTTGLSERSLAVLMMGISTATLFLPRLVMLPKVILRNKTAFLIPCSAGLLVGLITGYLRNTKSSSLNVIKRLRILLVSWCDSGTWERDFLNRLRISLQAERYSVPDRARCAL